MLRKIGKKLIHNFSLKIMAALAAVVLWIIVVNIDDPMKTVSYTTSVTLVNTDYITEQDKYYESLDTSNTVTFQVSAKRSVIEQLSSSDFSATADMEKIEYDADSDIYRVPISITNTKYSSLTITSKKLYMELALEDLGKAQKTITADTKGTVADGCALGEVAVVGSNLLKITGPSSIVSQVDTVKAIVNVEGMSSDVTDSVVPVLYDADGNVVDTTKLTLSISTVTVSAQILNTKDVTVEIRTPTKVASGYVITDMSYSPDTVRIKGESAVLNSVNKITVPSDVLNLSDATENVETTIDISAYLPTNTSLVLNSDAIVSLTVKIEPVVKKSFEVSMDQITVLNLADTYRAEFGVDTLTVEASGAQSEINSLTLADLTGTVDAEGLGEGDHTLTVSFELDEDSYQITADVEVPLLITSQTTDTETGTDTVMSVDENTEASSEKSTEEASTEASGEKASTETSSEKTSTEVSTEKASSETTEASTETSGEKKR